MAQRSLGRVLNYGLRGERATLRSKGKRWVIIPIDCSPLTMTNLGQSCDSRVALSLSRACLKSHPLGREPPNKGVEQTMDPRPPCPDCGCRISKVSKTKDGVRTLICQQCGRYFKTSYKRGKAPRRWGLSGGTP